ncbi:hypothetical protein CFP56_026567 [Quercus suber]|uniref:Uncharacterized protein n=1 Tax=Quercus suber TaxID=58331 RepID=A0AAW0K1I7_QUESU
MSHYDQQQAPVAYPSPVTAYPAQPQGPYVAPPPPIGYPTKVDSGYPQHTAPIETATRVLLPCAAAGSLMCAVAESLKLYI